MEGVFKDVMVLWVLAEEYSTWIFLGYDFWFISVFSSFLGLTVGTCYVSLPRPSCVLS